MWMSKEAQGASYKYTKKEIQETVFKLDQIIG